MICYSTGLVSVLFLFVFQITGDRTAIRKALVALSCCLQGDQPVDGSTTPVNKEGSMLPWASSEVCLSLMWEYCAQRHPQSLHKAVSLRLIVQKVIQDVLRGLIEQRS